MKLLVLGGESGIGQEVVNILEEGYGGYGASVCYVPTKKVVDVRYMDTMVSYLKDNGPFTHIVYTVGVARLAWADDLVLCDYLNDFTVNAFGFAMLLTHHRTLFPANHFSAVAVVSDAMRNPMRGSTTYCASKAALAAIIRNLAREWAPVCRVNGVAPAIVDDTPMTQFIDDTVPGFRGWDPEQAAAYERSLLPMGRRVRKEEVARVVIDCLFGPQYLTGSIIDITGGK